MNQPPTPSKESEAAASELVNRPYLNEGEPGISTEESQGRYDENEEIMAEEARVAEIVDKHFAPLHARIATLEAENAREKQAYLALASDKNDMEQELADLKIIRRTGKSEADYQFRERELRAHADALAGAVKAWNEEETRFFADIDSPGSRYYSLSQSVRESLERAMTAYAATKEGKS